MCIELYTTNFQTLLNLEKLENIESKNIECLDVSKGYT